MKIKAFRKCFFTLLVLALFDQSLLLAETYRWTDADGVMHFSDNPPKTPKAKKPIMQQDNSSSSGAFVPKQIDAPEPPPPTTIPVTKEIIIRGPSSKQYEIIGTYKVSVCKRNVSDTIDYLEHDALNQMRTWALSEKNPVNAVINIVCEFRTDAGYYAGCNEAVHCVGDKAR